MNIAHVAPFAVNRCGLYEAARDMARADILGGNTVSFIDAGVTSKGVRSEPVIGGVDNRSGFNLVTASPDMLNIADIIIMHTGFNDSYLVKNQAPLIWAVHGRPLACFKPERMKTGQSYSLYNTVSKWPRTKGMLYFWPEFKSHWENVLSDKDIILDYPVIDETRFINNGDKFNLKNSGETNILVCDSEREDIELYELTVGLCEAAKKYKGLKIHFYGMDMPEGKLANCHNILLGKLKKLGALGDVSGRIGDMEKLYNAVDCVISPNRIITRTIGEALSCGVPVISQNNRSNLLSDYTCDMAEPEDVVEAVGIFLNDKKNNLINKSEIRKRSSVFSLKNYSNKMNEIYKNIIESR